MDVSLCKVFTSAGLGTSFSSLSNIEDVLLPRKTLPFGEAKTLVAVNVGTGNVVVRVRGVAVPEFAGSLDIRFFFNSRAALQWRLAVEWLRNPPSVAVARNKLPATLTVVLADGHEAVFQRSIGSDFLGPASEDHGRLELQFRADHEAEPWVMLVPGTQHQLVFDARGYLLRKADSAMRTVTYGYAEEATADQDPALSLTTLTGLSGQSLTMTRSAAGAGTRLGVTHRDIDGASTELHSFSLDGTGRLTQSTSADGYSTVYSYGDGQLSTRLQKVEQSDGSLMQFEYSRATGVDVCEQVSSGGDTFFAIERTSATSRRLTCSTALDTEVTLDVSLRCVSVSHHLGFDVSQPAVETTSFSYHGPDQAGLKASVAHPNGLVETFDWEGHGLLAKHVRGDLTRTIVYEQGRPLPGVWTDTLTGGGGGSRQMTSRRVYERLDPSGTSFLRFAVSPMGRVTEYRPDRLLSVQSAREYIVDAYPVAGLSPELSPALSDMKAFVAKLEREWQAAGVPAKISLEEFDNDARGQVTEQRSYAELPASWPEGYPTASTSTTGIVTLEYDAFGNVTTRSSRVDETAVATEHDEYDQLSRLISGTDALGRNTAISYDRVPGQHPAGEPVYHSVVTLPSGMVQTEAKSASGAVLSEESVSTDNVQRVKSMLRDKGGRLVQLTTAGLDYFTFYDKRGHLGITVSATGRLTTFENHADAYTVETKYATGLPRQDMYLQYPPNGQLPLGDLVARAALKIADPANDATTYTFYDRRGNKIFHVDAERFLTQLVYDLQENVAVRIQFAQPVDDSTLSSLLQGAEEVFPTLDVAVDRCTSHYYDSDGRMLATVDAEGFMRESLFVANHFEKSRVLYATRVSAAEWQAQINELRVARIDAPATALLARLRPAASAGDARTLFFRDRQGAAVAEVNPEGFLTTTAYNAAGKPVRQVRYMAAVAGVLAAQHCLLDPPPPTPTPDPNDRIAEYAYDLLLRRIQSAWLVRSGGQEVRDSVKTKEYDVMDNVILAVDIDERAADLGQAGGDAARGERFRFDEWSQQVAHAPPLVDAKIRALESGSDPDKSAKIEALWATEATRFTYDGDGLLVREEDSQRRRVLFYNDERQVVYEIAALDGLEEHQVDLFGRLVSTRRYHSAVPSTFDTPGGLVSRHQAALAALVAQLRDDAQDVVEALAYDRRGLRTSSVDGEGCTRGFRFNAFGEVVERRLPLDDPTAAAMCVCKEYDRLGRVVALSRKSLTSAATETRSTTVFNSLGKPTLTTDEAGHATTRTYDRLGREATRTDPDGYTLKFERDALGRLTQSVNGAGRTTTFERAAARREEVIGHAGTAVAETITFNIFDEQVRATDARGATTTRSHTAGGEVARSTDELGASQTMEYNELGWLLAETDEAGCQTAYTHAPDGAVRTKVVGAEGAGPDPPLTSTYAYDTLGRLVAETNPRGLVSQYQYDRRNLRVGETFGDRVQAYAYNCQGTRVRSAAESRPGAALPAAVMRVDYPVDELNRVRGETRYAAATQPLAAVKTRDARDRVLSETDAEGHTTRFVRDGRGLMAFVITGEGFVTELRHDGAGELAERRRYVNPVNPASLSDATTPAEVHALVAPALQDSIERWLRDDAGRQRFRVLLRPVTTLGVTAPPLEMIVSETVYNDASQMVEEVAYEATPALPTQELTVDSLSTLMQQQQRAGDRHVWYVLDAKGQQRLFVDAESAVSEQVFNPRGQVVALFRYANAITNPAAFAALSVDAARAKLVPDAARDQRSYSGFRHCDGLPLFKVNPTGAVHTYTHDEDSNVTVSVKFAAPLLLPAAYEDVAAVAAAVAKMVPSAASGDRVTSSTYGPLNNPTLTTNALGATDTFTRDAHGHLRQHTDRHSGQWAFEYDGAGRLLRQASPAVAVSSTAVLPQAGPRNALSITTATRQVVIGYMYNGNDEVVREDKDLGGPDARSVEMTVTPSGKLAALTVRQVAVDDPTKSATLAGFLAPPTVLQDVTTGSVYDALGHKVVSADPSGGLEFMVFDGTQRMRFRVNPDLSVVGFERNAFGEVTLQTRYAARLAVDPAKFRATGMPLATLLAGVKASPGLDRTLKFTRSRRGNVVGEEAGPAVTRYNGATTYVGTKQKRRTYNALNDPVTEAKLVDGSAALWATTYRCHDLGGHVVLEAESIDVDSGSTPAREFVRVKTKAWNAFGEPTQTYRYATPFEVPAGQAFPPLATVLAQLKTDPSDRIVTKAYDRVGDVTVEFKVGNPNLWRDKLEFNAATGQFELKQQAFPKLQVSYAYSRGRTPLSTTYEDGGTEAGTLDARGSLVAQRSEPRTAVVINPATAVETEEVLHPLEAYDYNAHKQKIAITKYKLGAASGTSFQPRQPQASGDSTEILTFDNRGLIQFMQDANGHVTGHTYTADGKLARRYFVRTNGATTHVDEERNVYDAMGRLASTHKYRDGASVQATVQRYNTFGDATGEGPSASDLAGKSTFDEAGNLLATNLQGGVPSLRLRDSADNLTATIQATSTDLLQAASSDAAALVAAGATRFQDIELTRMQNNLLGEVKRKYLPRFSPGPTLVADFLPLQMLFSTKFPDIGARSVTWPIPQESNVVPTVTMRSVGIPTAAPFTQQARTFPETLRQGVDVSGLPTDVYDWTISFQLKLPSGLGPDLYTSSGRLAVINPSATSPTSQVVPFVTDEHMLHLVGATAGVGAVDLFDAANKAKVGTVPLQPEAAGSTGELVGDALAAIPMLQAGEYFVRPSSALGPLPSDDLTVALITPTAGPGPVGWEMNSNVKLFFLGSHGELDAWGELPASLRKQPIRLTVVYLPVAGAREPEPEPVSEVHTVAWDADLGTFEDDNKNLLHCNVELDQAVSEVQALSVAVRNPYELVGGAWIPLHVGEAPGVLLEGAQHFRLAGVGVRQLRTVHSDRTAARVLGLPPQTSEWVLVAGDGDGDGGALDEEPLPVPGVIVKISLQPRDVLFVFPIQYESPPQLNIFDVSHDRQATWKLVDTFAAAANGVSVEISGLAAGTYPYRIAAGTQAQTPVYQFTVAHGGIVYPSASKSAGPTPLSTGVDRWELYEWDLFGNRVAESNVVTSVSQEATVPTTRKVFNDLDKVVTTTFPATTVMRPDGTTYEHANVQRAGYSTRGFENGEVLPNGNVNGWALDEVGQQTRLYRGDGSTAKVSQYDCLGNEVASKNMLGKVVTQAFDGAGRIVSTTRPNGDPTRNGGRPLVSSIAYNERGERSADTNPAGQRRSYDRDVNGNVQATTAPGGQVFVTTRDRRGKVIYAGYPGVRAQTWQRDYFGYPLTGVDHGGASLATRYDSKMQVVGQTSSVTGGAHGRWAPFVPKRVYRRIFDGRELLYVFLDTYELGPETDVPGESLTMEYTAGRLVKVVDNVKGVTTTYDYNVEDLRALVQVANATDLEPIRIARATYDALGRLATFFDTKVSGQQHYDPNGNLVRTAIEYTDPTTGEVVRSNLYSSYDVADRPLVVHGQLSGGAAALADGQGVRYGYDPASGLRVSEERIAGGATQTKRIGYYEDMLISTITSTAPGDDNLDWHYDAAGVRVLETRVEKGGTRVERAIVADSNGFISKDTETKGGTVASTSTFTAEADGTSQKTQVATQKDSQGNDATYSLTMTYMSNSAPMNLALVSGYTQNSAGRRDLQAAKWLFDPSGVRVGKTGSDDGGPAADFLYVVSDSGVVLNRYRIERASETSMERTQYFYTVADNYITSITSQPWVLAGQVTPLFRSSSCGRNSFLRSVLTRPQPVSGLPRNLASSKERLTQTDLKQITGKEPSFSVKIEVFMKSVGELQFAAVPRTYTVQPGDTFAKVASRIFGDPGFGAAIAAENGYGSAETPPDVGTILDMPLFLPSSNNVDNATPYAALVGEIIGGLMPHLVWAQPRPKKRGCGSIILSVVISVVAIAVAGPIGVAAGGGLLGALAAGAAAAATSAALQAVAVGVGALDRFSWSDVVASGLSAGFAGYGSISFVQNSKFLNAVLVKGFTNIVTQLTMLSLGFTDKFDINSLLSALGGAAADFGLGKLGLDSGNAPDNLLKEALTSSLKDAATKVVGSVVFGADLDWESLVAEFIGSSIGQVLGASLASVVKQELPGPDDKEQRLEGGHTEQEDATLDVLAAESDGSHFSGKDVRLDNDREAQAPSEDHVDYDEDEDDDDDFRADPDTPPPSGEGTTGERAYAAERAQVERRQTGAPPATERGEIAARAVGAEVSHEEESVAAYSDETAASLVAAEAGSVVVGPEPVVAATPTAASEPSLYAEAGSLALDVVPFVGSGKSILELVTGEDAITGEPVNRWVSLGGVFLGVLPGGGLVKGLGKGAAKVIGKTAGKEAAEVAAKALAKDAGKEAAELAAKRVPKPRGKAAANPAKERYKAEQSAKRRALNRKITSRANREKVRRKLAKQAGKPTKPKATRSKAPKKSQSEKDHGTEYKRRVAELKEQSLDDKNVPKHIKGWIKNELRQRGNFRDVRNPPGYDVDHVRNGPGRSRWEHSRSNRSRGGRKVQRAGDPEGQKTHVDKIRTEKMNHKFNNFY